MAPTPTPTEPFTLPFSLEEAEGSPLVVSVPHAGTYVPPEDRELVALDDDERRHDADLFVDKLTAFVSTAGVTRIVCNVSRYVIDTNRAPDDVDELVCPDHPKPARASPRGLIWRQTTEGAPAQKRPLTYVEVQSRLARVHAPYHARLAQLLAARRAAYGFAVLLDVHSMPSSGRGGHADASKAPETRARADIVPGDLKGASCGPKVTARVVDVFEGKGFVVRPNEPYMGGYITRQHGAPRAGVHAIQLEVNRGLYMDEKKYRYDEARARRVIDALRVLIERLKSMDPR